MPAYAIANLLMRISDIDVCLHKYCISNAVFIFI